MYIDQLSIVAFQGDLYQKDFNSFKFEFYLIETSWSYIVYIVSNTSSTFVIQTK